jgi:hypothetical protein
MNTNTPPEQTALKKTELEVLQSIALQLDVLIGQILLDHDHGLVLDALLGAYIKQVTRCPGCTETASLLLPVVGSQLKAIAAAMVKPADKPLH